MTEISNGFAMEMNKNIRLAAIAAVRSQEVKNRLEIPDCPGTFVALASDEMIQATDFFTEDDIRYVIGPLRK